VVSLEPNEEGVVNVSFDSSGYSGHEVKSVYIKYSGAKEELRLVVTAEVK
jgi:hypothetical protein